MHPVIIKTFGGLSKAYYFRQFIFGLIFPIILLMIINNSATKIHFSFFLMLIINTLFYPYSRFVYESIVDFILGKNVFLVNAIFMLFVKIFTMVCCWSLALFMAPLGLIYLYYLHSRALKSM